MLDNPTAQEYVIQVIGRANPLNIKLPIIPSKISEVDNHIKVLTIDDCTFTAVKSAAQTNFITPSSDFVKLMFNNGTGCFDQTGRQTQLLQILAPYCQIADSTLNNRIKTWRLVGSTDPFLWTFGHDLQLGFSDVNGNVIDFSASGLNTDYAIIIQINMQ